MKKRMLLPLLVAMLLGGLGGAEESRPTFPEITFSDPEGRVVEFKSYQGAVVLLNFWATWCGPCRTELPELQKLYGELGGRGFVVLAVAVDTPPARVRPFMERLGLTMPGLLLDGLTQRRLGIDRVPYSILIDREGKVAQIYPGYSPEVMADLRQRAEALLGPPAKQGGK